MATRMQQRRGTAAQWTSANPILAAGEIGFESDTNQFKIGDGIDHWDDLSYFKNLEDLGGSLDDYILLTQKGAADGVAELNAASNVLSKNGIVFEGLTANEYETVLGVTDPTADRTVVIPDASGTVVLADNSGNVVVSGDLTVNGTTTTINSTAVNVNNEVIFEGTTADAYETKLTVIDPTEDRVITFPNATGSVILDSGAQTLYSKSINLNSNTLAGTISEFNTALSDADFTTLSGTETLTNKTLTSPKINGEVILTATAAELNILDGVTATAEQINVLSSLSATAAELNILDGVTITSEELNVLSGITATSAELNILDGVTATAAELNILDGVTSSAEELNILDGVIASTEELNILNGVTATAAQINVLASLTSSAEELNILDGATLSTEELNYVDGVTSSIQSQLNDKQPKITGVSDTEIEYLDGVTSSIQTQLNNKQDAVSGVSNTEIGYLDGVTSSIQNQLDNKQAVVANVSDTEIGYLDGVTSGIQGQIDGKASASHTHAQSDITNLTSDLAAKANLSGATFTGAVVLAADPSSSLHAATKQYVDNTASGVIAKPQVLGATALNIDATYSNGTAGVGATLTHNTNGVFPADAGGASGWAVGKGILVKNQTNKAQNGRYYISNMGSVSTPYVLTRCTYCDEASEIPGAYIFVQDGTSAGTGWIQVVADPATFVVGTDNIDVFQFSGSGTITAGTNISVSGNEVSVVATPSLSGVAFTDGTQTKEGVPSRTPIVQKTASYELSTLTHRDSLIEVSSASATTLTIPLDATVNYPVGTTVDILQTNTGQVTIAGAAGVTVNSTPGLKLRTRWSSATLMKRAANTWVVYGDLTA